MLSETLISSFYHFFRKISRKKKEISSENIIKKYSKKIWNCAVVFHNAVSGDGDSCFENQNFFIIILLTSCKISYKNK